jgi:hypothetical protein
MTECKRKAEARKAEEKESKIKRDAFIHDDDQWQWHNKDSLLVVKISEHF